MKAREPQIPSEDRFNAACKIKKRFCKVAEHVNHIERYDKSHRPKYIEKYHGVSSISGKPFECEVSYERFLTPELLFSPEIAGKGRETPIHVLIDRAIQMPPIYKRRDMYGNIVLSGDSNMFKGLASRLQHEVQVIVDQRLKENAERESRRIGRKVEPGKVQVRIIEHCRQKYAVWCGGTLFANGGQSFLSKCYAKQQYDEVGPSIIHALPIPV